MAKVLIVGAGGVGNVVAQKCAQAKDVFSDIMLASRTLSRCEAIQQDIAKRSKRTIQIRALDADNVLSTTKLLQEYRPDVLLNVALPYQDLTLMDACLNAGIPYLDTANYEPRDVAKFEYKWQWAYQEKFKQQNLMATLGCGFDPGITNVFCAYAQKHLFDKIDTIDIVDCNAGSHGHPFATNFNPEINIREITQRGRYYENGTWVETDPLAVSDTFDFPEVGPKKAYLLFHEELESLAKNIKGVKRMRFWMTFSESYINHLRVLENVGMTRIDPVDFQGHKIVPIQFLKAVLPDPSSLGENYQGKTSIGCIIDGKKAGQQKRIIIYNVCDHAVCFQEVGAQAISYTTGVPAMIGGLLMVTGAWKNAGIFNVEELDPMPMLEQLPKWGLPWHIKDYT